MIARPSRCRSVRRRRLGLAAPDTASADYFRMLRLSELQDGQFVAGSMVHARAERCDMRPAVWIGGAQVHDSGADRGMRVGPKSAQFAQEQEEDGGDGRQPHEDADGNRTEAEARRELYEREQNILGTLPRLATIQTHPGRKTERWIQEYTVGVDKLAHPDDWARFVAGDENMPLSKVRSSKTVFSIPPFKGWEQDWDNADELQEGILVHVPRDDGTCVRISDVVLAKNKVAQQAAMRAELK